MVVRQLRPFREFVFLLALHDDSIPAVTAHLNQFNPRRTRWTEKYMIQVRSKTIKISKYLSAAIFRAFAEAHKSPDPRLPIWVGRANRAERIAIYKIPPRRRMEVLEEESNNW